MKNRPFDYDAWIKSACRRLEALYEQKAATETEIANLERTIEASKPLLRTGINLPAPAPGITDTIREILRQDRTLHSPTLLRDKLLEQGTPLRQKNPLATIHQILARLLQNGEVKLYVVDGANRYTWNFKQEEDGRHTPASEGKRSRPRREDR